MSDIIKRHPQAPHKAIVWIEAEIHEITHMGECCGDPCVKIQRFPVAIDAANKSICEVKLNEFLAEVKKKCSQS